MSAGSSSILDFFKPRRNEAALKLRNSAVSLFVLFVLTNLSPLPSLWTSTWLVFGVLTRTSHNNVGYGWWTLCVAQGMACIALVLTILQAAFALKYPRESLPPLATPSKPLRPSATSSSQKQFKFEAFSPKSSPKQKPFSMSSSYAASPVSTPSRTLNYTIPSTTSPFSSTAVDSSISTSTQSSPSPLLSSPLAAYRGKHSQSLGHALTGSFLGKVARSDDSDED